MSSNKLTSPSVLREFLREQGIVAKKGLSQNFLIDENILLKIIKAADIQPEDRVLEVGPGPGALTQQLLRCGVHVVAVEKDPLLAKALRRLDPKGEALRIETADILAWPVKEKLTPPCKLVANIPYQITTPLLTRMVPLHTLFTKIAVMVQLEVAKRLTASPGSKLYGAITVFLNYYSRAHLGFTVKRTCFFPKPKVDSGLVVIEPVKPAFQGDEKAFFSLVRTAFGERRKTLRRSLAALYGAETVASALKACNIEPNARPETLSVPSFLALYGELATT